MNTVTHPTAYTGTNKTPDTKVLVAGAVGQFVEFYDFAIYGFSVVVIANLFFPKSDPIAAILAAFAVYGLAFVARPLGGVFFGTLGDRIGRRRVLSITLLAIGAATAIIGLLPSYESVGLWAPIGLLICRLVQGFSAGGEAVGAPSFVLEHAPKNRRGLWVAITIAMSALPSIFAGVLILGIVNSMPETAYADWGWRIPFFIAAPLSIIGLYIRNKTEESEAFEKAIAEQGRKKKISLMESLRDSRGKMAQVFLIVSLNGLTFYFLVGFFVTYLQTTIKLSQQQSLLSNAVCLLTFSVLLPAAGAVSDRVGRKPMLIAGSLLIALLAVPAFHLLTMQSLATAIAAQVLLAISLAVFGGGSYTFFVELFPTQVRFTGAAISYNISYAVFGGSAPFLATYLIQVTGSPIAPAYYLAAVAIMVFITALTVPETSRRDLNSH